MNYIQKNRTQILLAAAGLVLLTALIFLGVQKKKYGQDDMVATVYPNNLNVGDRLTFEDKSPFGKIRKWVITDGFETSQKSGSHVFTKPGYYQVTLILDNKFSKTFPVLVSAAAAQAEPHSPTVIDAPTQAMQLENVLFRAESPDAKVFTWKFGETGNIDSKDKMATYAFKNPGLYTVLLYTDSDTEPISHQIRILPSYPVQAEPEIASPPPPTKEEVYGKISDDFRNHLQQIALGNSFNMHYNYLISTYLCSKDNVSVTVNGKNDTFYNYCIGLQFDKNNLIQEVATTVDPGQNCVTKVEVKQSKQ